LERGKKVNGMEGIRKANVERKKGKWREEER
jgi:hypothetical protein